MNCDCEFDPKWAGPEENGGDGEESWHFTRTCAFCGTEWAGLHCPHDGYQNPCPACGLRPAVVLS